MKNYGFKWLFAAFVFLCYGKVCAQQKPPTPFKLYFEKVYLHTDRELYAAGDTLWYKAYLTNAQTGQLAETGSNLYVELITPTDSLLSRQIIKITDGLGNGDLSLPNQLASGKYRLRAYTNWMRNFGDDFVFEVPLIITGEIAEPASTPISTKKADKSIKKTKPVAVIPAQPAADPVIVRFYPEGGSLVKGISSLIAVKAEVPVADHLIEGTIHDASGKMITQFKCDSLGMAQFSLRPLDVAPYQARIRYGDKTLTVALPPALPTGFTLKIVRYGSNVKAIINCDEATAKLLQGQKITIAGKHSGKTLFTEQLTLASAQDSVDVPVEVLEAGVASITLYDPQLRPQAERLIFVEPTDAPQVTLTADKPAYAPKEQVNLAIKITEAGKPVNAALSLAAVNADAAGIDQSKITAYMLLQSELRGRISNADQYFDTTNHYRHKQIDQLLLTQGWRDFVWRHLVDTAIAINYAPEQGFSLTGRLRQKFANKPLVKKQVVATLIQGRTDSHMYLAITDSAGKYRFDHLPVKGKRDVELAALNGNQQSLGWLFVDSVKANILAIKPILKQDTVTQVQEVAITKLKAFQQSQAMRNNKTIKLKEVKVKGNTASSPNYAAQIYRPDQVFDISPKDHPNKTLLWFLLQNLKGVLASNEDSISGILIPGVLSTPPGPPVRMLIPPILAIDGRENVYEETSAEADRKVVYDLPIESVKRVVLKHLYGTLFKQQDHEAVKLMVGDIYVLELTLKPGALKRPDVTKTSMEVNGYYQARTFYQPVNNQPDALYDYRTTLLWQPNIQTTTKSPATVSFYNTNDARKVRIIVQGITAGGLPVWGMKEYEVK